MKTAFQKLFHGVTSSIKNIRRSFYTLTENYFDLTMIFLKGFYIRSYERLRYYRQVMPNDI